MNKKVYVFTEDPPKDVLKDFKNIINQPYNILGITHPDLHGGYSLPIGSTLASLNHISPEAVGFDINCGVCVVDLKINMTEAAFEIYRQPLINLIKSNIYVGLGGKDKKKDSNIQIFGIQKDNEFSEILLPVFDYFEGFDGDTKFNTDIPIDTVLNEGVKNLRESFQFSDVLYKTGGMEYYEFEGSVTGNAKLISQKSKSKGINCLQTVGSGNHYIEIVHVKELINENLTNILPFKENSILALIHTGSRGLGHQVCSDTINKHNKQYQINPQGAVSDNFISKIETFKNVFEKQFEKTFSQAAKKYKESINDVNTTIGIEESNSPLFLPLTGNCYQDGVNYIYAHNSAMNYAYTNRFLLANDLIRIFEYLFKVKGKIFCDSSHNMASVHCYNTYCNILDGNINSNEIHTHLNNENSYPIDEDILVIHKKGSTNVLPPTFFNPSTLKHTNGMPFIIGGSCFTNSYMMFSTNTHLSKLCSDAHGSGRLISRKDCFKQEWSITALNDILESNNTSLIGTEKEMLTENGFCYRNVNEIVKYLFKNEPETNQKAVNLKPLMVIKG